MFFFIKTKMNYTKYNVEERANKIEQKVTEQVSFADDEIENYVQ